MIDFLGWSGKLPRGSNLKDEFPGKSWEGALQAEGTLHESSY